MSGTRRAYKCRSCDTIFDIFLPLRESLDEVPCLRCGCGANRYFGTTRDVPINYGYRESRYTNKTDADIAKYQFTHL